MSNSPACRLLFATLAALACQACERPGITEIDSGLDVRIDAIISLPSRDMGYFAATTTGLVADHDGNRWQLSSHALRGFTRDQDERYWVVGDHGFIVFTEGSELGPIEWELSASATEADLHAIVAADERVAVVGDEILLVGAATQPNTYVWTEPEAPNGGWGRLRDISTIPDPDAELPRFIAVGLQGRALLSTPGGESWTATELGTDTDLS